MINSGDITLLSGKFIILMLIFVRISGMFVTAPFLRNPSFPMQLRIMLIFFLSVLMTSAFWKYQPVIEFDVWNLIFLVLKEMLIGVMIGFAGNAVFWGVRLAGSIIDFDMGFQAAMVFASDDSAPSLTGEYFELAALMVFLIINGHHYLLQGIYLSIKAIPLTTAQLSQGTVNELIRICSTVMVIGIKVSSPVIIALFLTNLALTLLARVAPQTNIFVLSFQIKVVVGLSTIIGSIPLMIWLTKLFLQGMESELMRMIITLNPGKV